MNAVAIDTNVLNGLFDNQKKLDDLFDSIFDDENYFISISASTSQSTNSYSAYQSKSHSSGGSRFNAPNAEVRRNTFYYLLPIALELAAIYLIVTNLL